MVCAPCAPCDQSAHFAWQSEQIICPFHFGFVVAIFFFFCCGVDWVDWVDWVGEEIKKKVEKKFSRFCLKRESQHHLEQGGRHITKFC